MVSFTSVRRAVCSNQFLAVVRKHLEHGDYFSATNSGGTAVPHRHGHGNEYDEASETASKVDEVFKQMDIRGDGDVSWDDFSAVRVYSGALYCG